MFVKQQHAIAAKTYLLDRERKRIERGTRCERREATK